MKRITLEDNRKFLVTVRKEGNGGGITLPKAWIGKKVVVELDGEKK